MYLYSQVSNMTKRVHNLRKESVGIRPYISTERAELLTEFYKSSDARKYSVPVTRALALAHIIAKRSIYIGEGELIVGERGPAPKATPTYPELCCHSLEDLQILNNRERTSFCVSEEAEKIYADAIIPFWQQQTIRDRVFEHMSEEWKRAFDAGVFTEFMEQRAPGHAILDDKIYHNGLLDFKAEIEERRKQLDLLNDPKAYEKDEELKAMAICCDAVMNFAGRHAELAKELADRESDPGRKTELLHISEVCSHVPAYAPRTFHEALQSYWFVHLGVITELNTWDSFNPGRLDQHLISFYQDDCRSGSLDSTSAKELLQCFWIKFNNQPAPPKVGITEEQSGTYQDFALINVGGLKADGTDAVNELSFLILDVAEEMQQIQPSICIQLSEKNGEDFLHRAGKVIKTGLGQPSVFNTEVILEELANDGKSREDALCGGPSGCVTVSAFGKESCTLTGYCNWPKVLEVTLNRGKDPRTGEMVGIDTGDPNNFAGYSDLLAAFQKQLAYFIDVKIAGNNIIERIYANHMPAPFMSVVMNDCIQKGLDYHNGGARYNPTYIQGVGIGTTTDSLAAIKHHVFTHKSISMEEMLFSLASNFDGNESLRQRLFHDSPRYGNDDPMADDIAEEVFWIYYHAVNGRPNTKGGRYRVNLLPTTVHVYFGSVLGATPNGRLSGYPVSEGISPTQGADIKGPTAVLKSAARIDHSKTGGTLLNMKFTPQMLDGDGVKRLGNLIRSYFAMRGHHIQFNVVDVDTLREAQADPASHRDLIVRVAGYSDYFIDIGKDLQNEIISRSEQPII